MRKRKLKLTTIKLIQLLYILSKLRVYFRKQGYPDTFSVDINEVKHFIGGRAREVRLSYPLAAKLLAQEGCLESGKLMVFRTNEVYERLAESLVVKVKKADTQLDVLTRSAELLGFEALRYYNLMFLGSLARVLEQHVGVTTNMSHYVDVASKLRGKLRERVPS